MPIDITTPINQPIYKRVELDMRDQISTGKWVPGMILPSRVALSKQYGVGLGTLERAVAALIEDGVLQSAPGSFTRVSMGSSDSPSLEPHQTSRPNREVTHRTSRATIGIISPDPVVKFPDDHRARSWVYTTARSLEQSYLPEGGITLFKSLHIDDQERIPIQDAILDLKDRGANTIAIDNLNGVLSRQDLVGVPSLAEREKIRIIHLASTEVDLDIPQVYYDMGSLGRQAALHCISYGHRSFTFVSPLRWEWAEIRCEKARESIMEAGLGKDALRSVILGDEMGYASISDQLVRDRSGDLARTLLTEGALPTCIIAANDIVGHGVIDALSAEGLEVGRDYSIIGFDDHRRSIEYQLTSFRPPVEAIGEEAASLLSSLEKGDRHRMQVKLRSVLISRGSVANLNSHST